MLGALSKEIAAAADSAKRSDAKSRINEYAMQKGVSAEYREEKRTGAPHMPVFTFSLLLGGEVAGEGSGTSKREAQQAAAREALGRIEKRKPKK